MIDGPATKPFGFVPYYPGLGLGGHCIPIDPFYLSWKAGEYGINTRFIQLAGEINHQTPAWVVGKLAEGLNQQRKPVYGSRVLVLGLAYTKDIEDTRESPSVEIMRRLEERGATVDYPGPHVLRFPTMRRYCYDFRRVELTPETLAADDAVLIATDHDAFDYEVIREHAPLIVDARGVYRERQALFIRA